MSSTACFGPWPARIGAKFKTDTGICVVPIFTIPFPFEITPIVPIGKQKSKINAYSQKKATPHLEVASLFVIFIGCGKSEQKAILIIN
jgi:hypothetical protein